MSLKYSYNFHNKISKLIISKYLNGKYIVFLASNNSELIKNVRDNTEQARLVIQNIFTIIIESLIFFGLFFFIIYKSSLASITAFFLIVILSLLYSFFHEIYQKNGL